MTASEDELAAAQALARSTAEVARLLDECRGTALGHPPGANRRPRALDCEFEMPFNFERALAGLPQEPAPEYALFGFQVQYQVALTALQHDCLVVRHLGTARTVVMPVRDVMAYAEEERTWWLRGGRLNLELVVRLAAETMAGRRSGPGGREPLPAPTVPVVSSGPVPQAESVPFTLE